MRTFVCADSVPKYFFHLQDGTPNDNPIFGKSEGFVQAALEGAAAREAALKLLGDMMDDDEDLLPPVWWVS